MKNKAFTLIELLAVIVILAIIALIAVPIILNIIDDSKNSSNKRSIELYGKAVENAIANYLLTNNNDENITLEKIESYIKYKGNNVECEITNLNKNGTVYLEGCKVGGKKVEYTYGEKVRIIRPATETDKTSEGKVPQGNFEAGDEYIINVDGTHEYHFYVYGIENEKVSLIMSNNICDDGTLATSSHPCTVEWLSQEDFDKVPYNNPSAYHRSDDCAKGPITAMNYLYEATKNWSNIPNIDADYMVGCGNPLKTSGNVTTMTISVDDTITATYDNLKARLPYHRSNYNSHYQHYSSGLLEYLHTEFLENCSSHSGVSESCLLDKGVYGYWLESAEVVDSGSAVWCGYADAFINVSDDKTWHEMNGHDKIAGIRPVIELSKSDF